MAWLDCSGLDLDRPAFDFFHDEAGVAFSPGETFDAGCSQFVRFNFATSMEIADKIVDRMVSAIGKIDRNVVTAG